MSALGDRDDVRGPEKPVWPCGDRVRPWLFSANWNIFVGVKINNSTH